MATAARPFLLSNALAATLTLSACGGAGEPADADAAASLDVVAAFYPLEFLAARVGGDRVEVTGLTPPGAEPHDLEISPQLPAGLSDADLVVALGGFQPAVDEAVSGAEVPVADLAVVADRSYGEREAEHPHEGAHSEEEGDEHSEEHGDEHGDADPHVWLDPTHMAAAAQTVADALTELDPDGADVYAANVDALTTELTAVDEQAQTAFASCEVDTLVTTHDAFGYFGDRYGFEIRSINGLSPDQGPGAGTLAEISDYVARSNIQTVYTETLVSSDIADAVAAEAGAETAVLDPVEGLTDSSLGSNYLEVMRADIDTVRAGQACT